jgi:hypothetical protein
MVYDPFLWITHEVVAGATGFQSFFLIAAGAAGISARSRRGRLIMTERQEFIVNMRRSGKSLQQIATAYQKRYKTKQKPSRTNLADTLAMFGLWPLSKR